MLGNNNPQDKNANGIQSALMGLATILGLIIALLASASIHEYCASWMYGYLLSKYYNHSIAYAGMWLTTVLLTIGVYQLTRVVFTLLLMFVSAQLAFLFM